jgi:hypothetical protein
MVEESDRIGVLMVALQLHPALTNKQLAELLGFQSVWSVVVFVVKARSLLRIGWVVCEACGELFQPSDGDYKPRAYAYCAECCH